MNEAMDSIKDKVQSSLEDPQVKEEIGKKIRESLDKDEGKDLLKDMSVQLLNMAKSKKTGNIDVGMLKTIKKELYDFISTGKNDNTSPNDTEETRIPRFLAATTKSNAEFCQGDDVAAFKALLRSFIEPALCAVLTAVSGSLEIIDDMFEKVVFWKDDGPFAQVFGFLTDLMQEAARLFLFGNFDTPLPSEERVLPIRSTRPDADGNSKVFMASGCDSNFEGELLFYDQIKGAITAPIKALSESVGQWFNTPIEIVLWLVKQLFGIFDHMNKVCSYLDGYVQLALVEGTFENSRYILQETACRSVPELKLGHGCDGIDNDCNFHRDDCGEDIYPPIIELSKAAAFCGADKHVFQSLEDALECVKTYVIAVDDCHTVTTTFRSTSATPLSLCEATHEVEVSTNTTQCNQTSTDTIDVLVGTNIASPSCMFSKGPDVPPSLDISAAIERCSGKFIFKTIEDARKCVETHVVSKDDCRPLNLTVSLSDGMARPTSCETFFDHLVTVTSSVQSSVVGGCTSALSTTDTMRVFVDENVESPSCEFAQGPNLDPILDLSRAQELCSSIFFKTVAEAMQCIDTYSTANDAVGKCRPVIKTVSNEKSDPSNVISKCTSTQNVTVRKLARSTFISRGKFLSCSILTILFTSCR
jgi:hypothetical protein